MSDESKIPNTELHKALSDCLIHGTSFIMFVFSDGVFKVKHWTLKDVQNLMKGESHGKEKSSS